MQTHQQATAPDAIICEAAQTSRCLSYLVQGLSTEHGQHAKANVQQTFSNLAASTTAAQNLRHAVVHQQARKQQPLRNNTANRRPQQTEPATHLNLLNTPWQGLSTQQQHGSMLWAATQQKHAGSADTVCVQQ
jgi:hypothetical protein